MPERPKGYRGSGIYVHGGGFRIPAESLRIDLSTGDPILQPIVPELRADTFHHWLGVAQDARHRAEGARERGVATPLEDEKGFARVIEEEFRAGIVAVAASAFAADAFFASVVEHAPEARAESRPRDAKVFETLKNAFDLSGARQAALREPLRLVYRLRDQAVHPPADWRKPIAHPVYGLGMEPRFVYYRAENAVNAQVLIQNMIHVCVGVPKARYPALVEWCEAMEELVAEPDHPTDWATVA